MRGSRRLRLTFVLLLLSAFTLTALDNTTAKTGPLAALRNGIDTVFGPVESALGGAAGSVGRALGGLPRLGSYQSDNRRLQRQVDALNGRIAAMAGLQCQVDQFHQLMHLVDVTGYTTVPARVIAVGPASGFEWTAVIDAGARDGVKESMTVVTGAGLVGRTTRVAHEPNIQHRPHHVSVRTHVALLHGEPVLVARIQALQLVALRREVLRVRQRGERRPAQRGHGGAHHLREGPVDLHEAPLKINQGHARRRVLHRLAELGVGA